jgi:hypothetical protein
MAPMLGLRLGPVKPGYLVIHRHWPGGRKTSTCRRAVENSTRTNIRSHEPREKYSGATGMNNLGGHHGEDQRRSQSIETFIQHLKTSSITWQRIELSIYQ